MLRSKKKFRPPFAGSSRGRCLIRSIRNSAMAKKKAKSISLVDLPDFDVPASGHLALGLPLSSSSSPMAGSPLFSFGSLAPVQFHLFPGVGPLNTQALLPVSASPLSPRSVSPPAAEAFPHPGLGSALGGSVSGHGFALAGSPIEHVSGAPFVLIPDENIEAAKLEFKDFIYARFHGDYPSMGKIIGVVNAVWARTGPKIFVHNIGEGMYLLRLTNPRTRDVLLSRTCWNIGGLPMFVAPWAPDFSPDEPPLTSAIVPVEMRNVPYLLFNRESLSRIATAIGKPDCLAPETERKENFEVAKLYVRVDLTSPLPSKIISGFSNGRKVEIDVSYPWLPNKCALCNKFGHTEVKCPNRVNGTTVEKQPLEIARRRSKSRPGRSTEKKLREGVLRYVPVNTGPQDPMTRSTTNAVPDSGKDSLPPTSSLPSDETIELEEGEILQQSLEDTQLSLSETAKVSMEDNNDLASPGEVVPAVEKTVPVPSQALVAEVDIVVVQGVLDDIANQEATLHVAIVQGLLGNKAIHEPTLSIATEQVEKTIIEEAPIPTLSEVDDLSSDTVPPCDVILEVNNNANPPCGNSDESINIPPPAVEESIDIPPPVEVEEGANNVIPPMEEEEGGDPFYLVKNRRSGRKAAKRH
ncbi:hypothetical protein IGI04_036191 [Brassica rapa subsp. trilocularis]|uniref:DUF4283 domain-containing protein n=1 Tax=Brassica rapa subsp. trilocularis TaxID=1813537 RepID=A0ABQ7LDR9_BRACM|nr:hypothetical protein IGI04_036191 [Brassica rapa subsp. trilocularis]